jgi:putative transposase
VYLRGNQLSGSGGDEFLNGQQFDSLLEAQVVTEDWRMDYNLNRPHSAHGWLTPVEFLEAWLSKQNLQLV